MVMRWTAARVVLLLMAIVSVVPAVALTRPRGGAAARASRRYVDRDGWWLRYPRWMHLERSSFSGHVFIAEVTVANFSQRRAVQVRQTPNSLSVWVNPPLDLGRRFPQTGVAFRMLVFAGGPPRPQTWPDSRFPLRLSYFSRPHRVEFPRSDYRRLGVPAERELGVTANGANYTAMVLIGRHATPLARASLARVVDSLSFPKLHRGRYAYEFAVLRLAAFYPVGSFTLIHVASYLCDPNGHCAQGREPFYLVHAPGQNLISPCRPRRACTPPGGFYALGWKDAQYRTDYRSRCHLRFDRRREQFYCTNNRARWDRVGRVIREPRGVRVGDPLQFAFAKVAWDGHVLLDPQSYWPPPRGQALRLLWPTWHPSR